MEFDPASGELKCAFCGMQRAIAHGIVPYHSLDEMPLLTFQAEGEVTTLRCSHCGVQSTVPANVAATQCAFCAAPLTSLDQASTPPADGVVPFAVSKEVAEQHFQRWVKSLWFRPSNLRKLARLNAIRGIYLPNWSFDALADSRWSAEAGYYYNVETVVTVNGKPERRTERKIRWEPASGYHSANYADLLVSASKGLGQQELRAIEPFALNQLTVFNGDYLSGFEAESHAMDVRTAWQDAVQRIASEERAACDHLVPGDTHRNLHVSTVTQNEFVRSFLVPIYVAAYEYGGKTFRVVLNGQTGKATGKAPWSAWKITGFVILLAAIAGAIVWWAQQRG